jgi:hypothetical protein
MVINFIWIRFWYHFPNREDSVISFEVGGSLME